MLKMHKCTFYLWVFGGFLWIFLLKLHPKFISVKFPKWFEGIERLTFVSQWMTQIADPCLVPAEDNNTHFFIFNKNNNRRLHKRACKPLSSLAVCLVGATTSITQIPQLTCALTQKRIGVTRIWTPKRWCRLQQPAGTTAHTPLGWQDGGTSEGWLETRPGPVTV